MTHSSAAVPNRGNVVHMGHPTRSEARQESSSGVPWDSNNARTAEARASRSERPFLLPVPIQREFGFADHSSIGERQSHGPYDLLPRDLADRRAGQAAVAWILSQDTGC
jgi:hypothetical protein